MVRLFQKSYGQKFFEEMFQERTVHVGITEFPNRFDFSLCPIMGSYLRARITTLTEIKGRGPYRIDQISLDVFHPLFELQICLNKFCTLYTLMNKI